jgi:hypothetical protein
MTNTYTPPPPAPVSRTVKFSQAQEHLLRRLGGALVLQWDALPDDLQDLLIDQAALVDDREDAPHSANDIENFIRKAKTAPLAKPASEEEKA